MHFGWREGISADEAKPYAEEALKYAPNEPVLLAGYGRILGATGAADDYVRVMQDALKVTPSEGDVGRFATVNAILSQALFMAGRLNEALDAGTVALSATTEQGGFDSSVILGLNANQLLGFDVVYWIKCFRTRILVRLGRFGEAREWLADVICRTGPTGPLPSCISLPISHGSKWRGGRGFRDGSSACRESRRSGRAIGDAVFAGQGHGMCRPRQGHRR